MTKIAPSATPTLMSHARANASAGAREPPGARDHSDERPAAAARERVGGDGDADAACNAERRPARAVDASRADEYERPAVAPCVSGPLPPSAARARPPAPARRSVGALLLDEIEMHQGRLLRRR